jgi:hypothetical protein
LTTRKTTSASHKGKEGRLEEGEEEEDGGMARGGSPRPELWFVLDRSLCLYVCCRM